MRYDKDEALKQLDRLWQEIVDFADGEYNTYPDDFEDAYLYVKAFLMQKETPGQGGLTGREYDV